MSPRPRGAWSAAGLGIAFLLAAAAFGSPSLYVPGIALVLLALASWSWVELAARDVTLSRESGADTVVEDEPYPLRIEIHAGAVPLPPGELSDPLLAEPVRIGLRGPRELDLEVRFPRRGRRSLEPAALILRDPLRLHSRELRGGGGGELLVLPRLEPVLAATEGAGRGAGTAREATAGHVAGFGREATASELEVDGLRPYRDGSPASRIHWPTVARTGELVERRMVAGAGSGRVVLLDARHPADEAALDRAVRATASLCRHLALAGGCTALLPGEPRALEIDSRLEGWRQAHVRLALVGPDDAPPPRSRAREAAVLFWVTASGDPAAAIALARGGVGGFLVTPGSFGESAPAFTVAGCEGHPLAAARRLGAPAAELPP